MLNPIGACGSCPSSTSTMKMGIERVLKEKFGEAVKDICQVSDDPQNIVTTVEVGTWIPYFLQASLFPCYSTDCTSMYDHRL